MNEPSLPTPLTRKRGRIRAVAQRFLFVVAVLVTLAALVWTEENWRATRDWAACQQDMAARGERLDLTAAYDPLPPGRNLAWAPLFTDSFEYTVDAASGQVTFPLGVKYRLPQLKYMPTSPEDDTRTGLASSLLFSVYRGERDDLRAWQAYYRQHAAFGLAPVSAAAPLPAPAEDVMVALRTFSTVLDDVERSATAMPEGVLARAPASFGGGMYVAVRRIVQTLALRADAHLATGDTAAARHDLELIFWLRRATATEPRSLLNAAVGCNHLEMALRVVWQGLLDRRWTADDLAAIQNRLQGLDLLADYRRGASGERANSLFLIDGMQDGRYKYADLFSPGDGWGARASAWALMHGPGGWLVQNRVAITRFYQDGLLGCVDVPTHRYHPEVMEAGLAEATRICTQPVWPSRYLLATGVPGFLRVVERCALAQTALDEAIVACALERYALAHGGSDPTDLSALMPDYLDHVPTSVMDGTPLRYTTNAGGRYRLAAQLPLQETEKPPGSMVQGDELVWGYPSDH